MGNCCDKTQNKDKDFNLEQFHSFGENNVKEVKEEKEEKEEKKIKEEKELKNEKEEKERNPLLNYPQNRSESKSTKKNK